MYICNINSQNEKNEKEINTSIYAVQFKVRVNNRQPEYISVKIHCAENAVCNIHI